MSNIKPEICVGPSNDIRQLEKIEKLHVNDFSSSSSSAGSCRGSGGCSKLGVQITY